MERATTWDEFGNADVVGVNADIVGVESGNIYYALSFGAASRVTLALNRLAAYEDIGLTPQEIKDMMSAKGGNKS